MGPPRKALHTPVHSRLRHAGALRTPRPSSYPSAPAPQAWPAPTHCPCPSHSPSGLEAGPPCLVSSGLSTKRPQPLGVPWATLPCPGCAGPPEALWQLWDSKHRHSKVASTCPSSRPRSLSLWPWAGPLHRPHRSRSGWRRWLPLSVLQRGWGYGGLRASGAILQEGGTVCHRALVLDGGAGAGLGLQAPVGRMEGEHQAAAEDGAQAGHQQRRHWGDAASSAQGSASWGPAWPWSQQSPS